MRVALASATWNDAEQAQLQAVPDDQKIPLLRAFVTTRQSVFDQAQQTTSKINRSVKAAETTYQQARDRQQQFDRLTQAQADYQTKVEEQNRQASPSTLSKAINSIRLRAPLNNT
ncbi:hypothetical protein WP50_07020 [Lactiplantibacillus plantarum]|nr:hypothetical protein WP50_07020 [Lactiplantibacillus plantarum]